MASDLKSRLVQIEVEDGDFRTTKNKMMAESFLKMYSCQAILESSSEFLKGGNLVPGYDKYLKVTAALMHSSDEEWIKVFVYGFNDSNTSSLCSKSLNSLIKLCNIPIFKLTENYVYTNSDFTGVSQRSHSVLNILHTILKKIMQIKGMDIDDKRLSMVNISYFCLVLISRHATVNAWTETDTCKLVADCLKCIMEMLNVWSVNDLLVTRLRPLSVTMDEKDSQSHSNETTLLGKLLNELKPALSKSAWHQNPVAASSFCWCLENLKFPHLSTFMEFLLPPSLLFVDDHLEINKLYGLNCLICIIENCTAEELRWYGRAEVVYEALKHQLYLTEETVLRVTHKALLLILKVLVKDASQISVATKYDEILLMMLQNAAHENKLILRRIHTQHLHTYINLLGINVVKYMQKILDLAEDYLEIGDPPVEDARMNILKAIKSLLKNAWPRIHCQSYRLLKMIVKLIHQISTPDSTVSSENRTELIATSVDCLELLKAIDNETVTKSLTALTELKLSPVCVSCLKTVLNSIDG